MELGFRPIQATEPVSALDIQVLHVEGVVFDELAARLDLVAHQRGEHQVGFRVILGAHLEQRALGGIHRRFPQRVGIHLAEALVAVHREAAAAGVHEVLDELVERLDAAVGLAARGFSGGGAAPRLRSGRRRRRRPRFVGSAGSTGAAPVRIVTGPASTSRTS